MQMYSIFLPILSPHVYLGKLILFGVNASYNEKTIAGNALAKELRKSLFFIGCLLCWWKKFTIPAFLPRN